MDRIKNVSTDTIDFDVANYDEEELLAILRFENMPTNEGKISQRIQELLGEYKDKRFKKDAMYYLENLDKLYKNEYFHCN